MEFLRDWWTVNSVILNSAKEKNISKFIFGHVQQFRYWLNMEFWWCLYLCFVSEFLKFNISQVQYDCKDCVDLCFFMFQVLEIAQNVINFIKIFRHITPIIRLIGQTLREKKNITFTFSTFSAFSLWVHIQSYNEFRYFTYKEGFAFQKQHFFQVSWGP